MIKVSYNDKKMAPHESLGISEERMEELSYRMDLIVHEFNKPLRKGEKGPHTGVIHKLFLALAEDVQEVALVSFFAGFKVQELFAIEESQMGDELNDPF